MAKAIRAKKGANMINTMTEMMISIIRLAKLLALALKLESSSFVVDFVTSIIP
jgi:hypothetical protein